MPFEKFQVFFFKKTIFFIIIVCLAGPDPAIRTGLKWVQPDSVELGGLAA